MTSRLMNLSQPVGAWTSSKSGPRQSVEGVASSPKKLARVHKVYLDEAFASDTLEPLAAFVKLEELNCDAPRVHDLTPLMSLARFETLRISSKALTDFSPIAKLPKLKSLDLSDTAFNDLSVVSKLHAVRSW